MREYAFLDLAAVTAPLAEELKEAAVRVIDSGRYLRGEECEAFERELAALCGAKYCVAVSNGLDALRLIFRAYMELGRISRGDEVIVASNTYIASTLSITDTGLKAVAVEPEEETFNIDPKKIEEAITPATRAILEVHLYGTPCRHAEIQEIADRHGLLVIEDNAQGIGGMIGNRMTGNLGDAAAFSFYPTKNIGALGDAGAVTTSDCELAKAIRAIANYGSDRRYHNVYQGLNCRMDELQAAFLRVKLRHIEEETKRRNRVAEVYYKNIDNGKIIKPEFIGGMTQVWHQYVVRCEDRDGFRKYLADNGVQTDVHYAVPPHKQPCYVGVFHGCYPITERLADEVVSLPIAGISTDDAMEISNIINNY